jgi:hypothetical protein
MIEKTPAIGALAIVLFGGSAFGQQQYDSLGSPMPGTSRLRPGRALTCQSRATSPTRMRRRPLALRRPTAQGLAAKNRRPRRNEGPNVKAMGRPAVLRTTEERQAG